MLNINNKNALTLAKFNFEEPSKIFSLKVTKRSEFPDKIFTQKMSLTETPLKQMFAVKRLKQNQNFLRNKTSQKGEKHPKQKQNKNFLLLCAHNNKLTRLATIDM